MGGFWRPKKLPRGSPERPGRAPGAPQEAQSEPQEVQNEPQEAPNDPQEGQNEPQEGQSELREVPGGFRERFRKDFRGIFKQPARASKGCTLPTTLAIFMLAMLSPRWAICFVVPPGALLWFFSPFFVLLSSCFPSLRAACFRSLPRDRARKLRTKTLETHETFQIQTPGERAQRASKGCTRPTTLAILMLAMLSPRWLRGASWCFALVLLAVLCASLLVFSVAVEALLLVVHPGGFRERFGKDFQGISKQRDATETLPAQTAGEGA